MGSCSTKGNRHGFGYHWVALDDGKRYQQVLTGGFDRESYVDTVRKTLERGQSIVEGNGFVDIVDKKTKERISRVFEPQVSRIRTGIVRDAYFYPDNGEAPTLVSDKVKEVQRGMFVRKHKKFGVTYIEIGNPA